MRSNSKSNENMGIDVMMYACTWIELKFMLLQPWLPIQTKVNPLNTLSPRQNGRHFADDAFKCIFLNENVSISIEISLKFVPNGQVKNIPSLI